jgi:hypothetical protein
LGWLPNRADASDALVERDIHHARMPVPMQLCSIELVHKIGRTGSHPSIPNSSNSPVPAYHISRGVCPHAHTRVYFESVLPHRPTPRRTLPETALRLPTNALAKVDSDIYFKLVFPSSKCPTCDRLSIAARNQSPSFSCPFRPPTSERFVSVNLKRNTSLEPQAIKPLDTFSTARTSTLYYLHSRTRHSSWLF